MEAAKPQTNADEIDLQKYIHAGAITNAALKKIIEKCVEGAKVYDICTFGDDYIKEELEKVYTKKENGNKVKKGISFPVTININEVCNNFSPPADCETMIKTGDVVKISLGCHIDGHISIVGHTIYIGMSENEIIEGPKAEIIKNAHILSQLLLKSIKKDVKSCDITKNIQQASDELKCNVIPNCVTYQLKKFVVESNKFILLKENLENKTDSFTINVNDIYLIDVMVTTGEGKIKESDYKTTIYKRETQKNYQLKTSLGRSFINEVNKKFPILPFNIKYLEDQRAALIGIPEALRHDLIKPYNVFTEKKNEIISQFKYTVIVTETGIKQITGIKCSQIDNFKTTNKITSENLKSILNMPMNLKKTKSNEKVVNEEAPPKN
ncbi:proliferation-associated protein 2g4, putative [Hepatocystis sp. ex Piliocolobus tephrosceles]|nr:proliferation-associated protein 2g4, putative [Hepatocystis sp. ex Piliocolobus tephrosceles]